MMANLDQSDRRLLGLNALVTGAGSGLGQAIAVRYAKEGANIALNDIKSESLNKTIELLQPFGVKTIILPADVSDSNQVQQMAKQYYEQWPVLDVLVNNAGIGGSNNGKCDMPWFDTHPDLWESQLRGSIKNGRTYLSQV